MHPLDILQLHKDQHRQAQQEIHHDRLAERARRGRLTPRQPVLRLVGRTLIRLGERLQGATPPLIPDHPPAA